MQPRSRRITLLLGRNGFDVVAHGAEDPGCGGHAVWLARRRLSAMADRDAEGGRGLQPVASLAARWVGAAWRANGDLVRAIPSPDRPGGAGTGCHAGASKWQEPHRTGVRPWPSPLPLFIVR